MAPEKRPSQTDISGARAQRMADGGGSLLDRILEGLQRPRCRTALYCLADEEPQQIDELAGAIAEREADSSRSDEQRYSVKIALHHNVLPKLDSLQLIEYDSRSQTVCFRDSPKELEVFLQLCQQLDQTR